MDNLSLNEEKVSILYQFKNNVQDILLPWHDHRFLLRWLKARNFDLTKAEKMLRDDIKFRRKIGSDNITETYELRKELKPYQETAFLGFDNEGHPIRLINFGICDYKGFCRSMTYAEVLKYIILLLEQDTHRLKEHNKQTGRNVEKFIYICDYTDFKFAKFYDKQVLTWAMRLITMYQDHYPETLHVMYLINVTNFFFHMFNMLKPVMDESVLNKIKIYQNDSWQEEVFKTIPKEIVPAYLGGARYEPEGDPKCHALLGWKTKLPTELYLQEECQIKSNRTQKKRVREKSIFEIEKDIERSGLVLHWEFETVDYSIKFGLFYKPKRKNLNSQRQEKKKEHKREELIPIEEVDSHQIPEAGKYVCKKLGTYIFHFDNTYSWLTSKTLFYNVQIKSITES